MKKKTKVLGALALTAGLTAGVAGPAFARSDSMYLGNKPSSIGGIGVSTLNGNTYRINPSQGGQTSYFQKPTYSSPDSWRAVQMGQGYCVEETGYYSVNGETPRPYTAVVHRWPGATGNGWDTLQAATIAAAGTANNIGTTTELRLYRC